MLRLDINIVWTILNLLIIFAIVKIFLIKPIHKILDARQAEIDKQYADAKAAQDSAEELKTKYEASLSGVQAEKEGILNEARGKASNEYDRIVADAQTEAKKILDNADKKCRTGRAEAYPAGTGADRRSGSGSYCKAGGSQTECRFRQRTLQPIYSKDR